MAMDTTNLTESLESQLHLLSEEERKKVAEYVKSIIDQRRVVTAKDNRWIMNLVGIGSGPSDLAEEHDHYIYGTPKKGSD